jgi:hypothetical protein
MLIWNFCDIRGAILGLCQEYGINVVWWEDGFFPHYETLHFDPLGFCWESSLSRMIFRQCSDRQKQKAHQAREIWLAVPPKELPANVKKPFVLWPLQLINDIVNQWDLGLRDWTELLGHFRACLPSSIQLVLKDHPYSTARDTEGIDKLLPQLRNTIRVPREADLTVLLRECNAVAGANSSVLYEARLMHHKPVYAYGRSWFTNHDELFLPLRCGRVSPLPRQDWIEDPQRIRTKRLDDYSDWFLAQLLGRQLDSKVATTDPILMQEKIRRLSYRSFLEHGEAIFED